MTAPTPNAELAYKVLDAVNAHRNAFNMFNWWDGPDEKVTLKDLTEEKCGTAACFAGWAIALSGCDLGGGISRDGEYVSYSYRSFAQTLLRLNGDQADELFFGDGSDIEEVIFQIFGPRPASYGTGCRCTFLGENTPEHTPSPLCRSLRPEADRDAGEPE